MADSLQGAVQAALRAATGTTQTYEGDWHAYLDAQGIGAGQWDGRILAYAKTIDSTIGTANAANNYFLYNGITTGMLLGGNINNLDYFSSPLQFSNIFRTADVWLKSSGTGTGVFTDTRGQISGADALDVLRARLPHSSNWDQLDWPTGSLSVSFTLTGAGTGNVRIAYGNPTTMADGTGIYTSGAQSAGTYTGSSTSISHSTINGSAIYVLYQGSATLSDLKITLPNANSAAYGEFNPDFVDALTASGLKDLRFMDALHTNTWLDTSWSDRILTTDIRWMDVQGGNAVPRYPYETIIDLCNRVGANPWINIPTRAGYDSTYVQNLGAILATLTSGYSYVEWSNEVWNSTFLENTNWIAYSHVTTETASGNGAATPTFTLNSHGFTGGETVMCFNSKGNTTAPTFPLYKGNTAVIKTSSVTANTFQLAATAGGTAYTSTAGHNTLLFKRTGAASSQVWTNYATQLETIWTNLEATCSRAKMKYVLATKAADPSNSLSRFNALTADGKLKVDHVAIAPYIHPFWFECTLAGGGSAGAGLATATPTFSASYSTMVIKYAVYPSASTPTNAEIFAGTGATASNLTGTSVAYTSSTVAGTALTGLTSGTAYKLYCWTTYNSVVYLSSVAFTGATTGTMCTCIPNYADYVSSYAYEIAGTGGSSLAHPTQIASMLANIASAGLTNATLIAYEGYEEWTNTNIQRISDANPIYAAQTDATYSNTVLEYLYSMAAMGVKKFFAWKLISEDPYGLTRSATVRSGTKWTQYTGLPGRSASIYSRPVFKTAVPPDLMPIISSAPSYPTNIYSLVDSTGSNTINAGAIVYSIIGGNEYGRYDVSGSNLRIISGYSSGTTDTVRLKMLAGSKTVGIAEVPVVMGVPSPAATIPTAAWSYENTTSAAVFPLNTTSGSDSTLAFQVVNTNSAFGYANMNGVFPAQTVLNGQTLTVTMWAYHDASDSGTDAVYAFHLYRRAYDTVGAPSSSILHGGAGTFVATVNKTFTSTLTKYTLTWTNSSGVTWNTYTAGAPAGTEWLQLQMLKNSAADGVTRHINIALMSATVA